MLSAFLSPDDNAKLRATNRFFQQAPGLKPSLTLVEKEKLSSYLLLSYHCLFYLKSNIRNAIYTALHDIRFFNTAIKQNNITLWRLKCRVYENSFLTFASILSSVVVFPMCLGKMSLPQRIILCLYILIGIPSTLSLPALLTPKERNTINKIYLFLNMISTIKLTHDHYRKKNINSFYELYTILNITISIIQLFTLPDDVLNAEKTTQTCNDKFVNQLTTINKELVTLKKLSLFSSYNSQPDKKPIGNNHNKTSKPSYSF